jgi:hypothetical protein
MQCIFASPDCPRARGPRADHPFQLACHQVLSVPRPAPTPSTTSAQPSLVWTSLPSSLASKAPVASFQPTPSSPCSRLMTKIVACLQSAPCWRISLLEVRGGRCGPTGGWQLVVGFGGRDSLSSWFLLLLSLPSPHSLPPSLSLFLLVFCQARSVPRSAPTSLPCSAAP